MVADTEERIYALGQKNLGSHLGDGQRIVPDKCPAGTYLGTEHHIFVQKKVYKRGNDSGGGTGGGVSITPLAFLIVKNGDVKLLQVQSYSNTADRVVGMVPEVVDKVSGLINSKKAAPEAE